MSEQQFIRNTAPTLAGIKTGSLFPYHYSSKQEAVKALRSYNRRLTPKGLRLMPLRMTDTFAMLYLYRPGRLGRDLKQQDAAALLRQAGYPDCSEAACLRELRRRLSACKAFPHEIGLFLSYPPEDVRGFIEHRAADCKCVGCWKVYGDEAAARSTFARYQKCTDAYLRQSARGLSLERLTVKTTKQIEKEYKP